MMNKCFSRMAGFGSYLPERRVLNAELTQFPGSAIPLIEQKTGVRERRHAAPSESTSDLGARAALACLENAAVTPDMLDGIILATSSPDRSIPATATRVQNLVGAKNAFALDVNSVCSGAVYAMHLGDALIRSGSHERILIVASEIYSRILNPGDFSTYPYFGDGAGAVLLTKSTDDDGPKVVRTILKSDGAGADLIQVPAGGSMMPFSSDIAPKLRFFTMNGRAVMDFAVSKCTEIMLETLEKAQIDKSEVGHVVVHQANINIIRQVAEASGIPLDKFVIDLELYGNTAAASVLIALDGLMRGEKPKRGDLVLVSAFGAGLSWGCSLIRL